MSILTYAIKYPFFAKKFSNEYKNQYTFLIYKVRINRLEKPNKK